MNNGKYLITSANRKYLQAFNMKFTIQDTELNMSSISELQPMPKDIYLKKKKMVSILICHTRFYNFTLFQGLSSFMGERMTVQLSFLTAPMMNQAHPSPSLVSK